jgi:hypothetical protein
VTVELASHPDGPRLQVDVFRSERGKLRSAEASKGGQQHQRPVKQPDSIG